MKRVVVKATIGIAWTPSEDYLSEAGESLLRAVRFLDRRIELVPGRPQVVHDGSSFWRLGISFSVPEESATTVEMWAGKLKCGQGRL